MPPRKRKVPEKVNDEAVEENPVESSKKVPSRKRKVPEKVNDEAVEENQVESSKENDNGARKRRVPKKQKSNEVETSTSPQPTEKHVVIKILLNAQTNEAFHSKYIKELTNQYAKVNFFVIIKPNGCVVKFSFGFYNRLGTIRFWRCLFVV